MYVVHNATKFDAVYETASAVRSVKTLVADLPIEWVGDTVQVYLAFISEDGKEVANSVHVGSLEVTA